MKSNKSLEQHEALKRPFGCKSFMYVDINLISNKIRPTKNQLNNRDELIKFGLKNNFMMYVGTKQVEIELELGLKSYWTSSKNTKFRNDQVNPNMHFLRVHFDWGSDEEMRQEEHELLCKYRPGNEALFYNLNNQRKGVKKVRYEMIDELVEDVDKLRTNYFDFEKNKWDNIYREDDFHYLDMSCLKEPETVKELAKNQSIQVRHKKNHPKNTEQIKDRIDLEGGRPSRKVKAPVFLKNRNYSIAGNHKSEFFEKLQCSGEHTLFSYMTVNKGIWANSSKLPSVEIPPHVHELFTNIELEIFSNTLNERKDIQESYDKDDAIKECETMMANGNSYGTPNHINLMRKNGLTHNEVKSVLKEVGILKKRDDLKRVGKVLCDYSPNGKDRWLLYDYGKEYEKNDTFVMYGSFHDTLKLDHILISFLKANDERIEDGKTKYQKIVFVGYCNDKKIKDGWDNKTRPMFDRLWKEYNLTEIQWVLADSQISQIDWNEKAPEKIRKKTLDID